MSGKQAEGFARMNKVSTAVVRNPVTNSLKRAYETHKGGTIAFRSSILPNRNRTVAAKPNTEDYAPNEISQRAEEMICRFFLSQGLTYDAIENSTFANFVQLLNPNISLPTPTIMESCVEKMAFPSRPHINYQKAIGPLTATLDIFRHNDEIFLSYSIHYFDDYQQRKNAVYLRKLILCEFDGESIMTCVRRAINNFNYGNVRFTNLVTSNETIATQLYKTESVTHNYICFFTYLTRFVEEILSIDDFSRGLSSLRGFVLFLRRHADLYSKFRRLQLSKGGELDLPCLDNDKWISTTTFLGRCLALHETFDEFATRWRLTTYICDDTFAKLSYLQRLLVYVQRFARELSTSDSTVSQVVPTIVSIKCFLEQKSLGFKFDKDIKAIFTKHLFPLINGYEDRRYDFACLLDPRYGYRDSIYNGTHWRLLEDSLLESFAAEDVVINEKNPSESVLLKPHTKAARLERIKNELEAYRAIIACHRPPSAYNPFDWWGSRMMELTNLFNKSRELLAPPAVTIDTEHYFGRNGKYTHMTSKMTYQQLENALIVAAQQETFRGRGYFTETAQSPFFPALTSVELARKQLAERRPVFRQGTVSMNIVSKMTHDKTNLKDLDSMMMMQPPPEKRVRLLPEEPLEQVIKVENNINDRVKIEIEEAEEFPVARVPSVPRGRGRPPNKPAVESAPILMKQHVVPKTTVVTSETLKEVKPEPLDEEYEVKPPLLELEVNPSGSSNDSLIEPKVEPAEQMLPFVDLFPKRKQCNRKCSVCLRMEEHDSVKHVTVPTDKMIVLLGMVVDGKMSVPEARFRYTKGTKTYICRRHFHEARRHLFDALGVTNSDDIFNAKSELTKRILEILEKIQGTSMTTLQFKQVVIMFAEKYCPSELKEVSHKPSITFDTIFKEAGPTIEEPYNMITMARPPDVILPKALRPPRKQVLTRDEEDEPIIRRIIHHKPWAVQTPAECEPSRYKNPGRCCYCQRYCERSDMLRVPKSEDRRFRWFEKLGVEFERKVKSIDNPFICRSHFPPNSFSSRGRLLKGMLPCTPDEIITYKIKGGTLSPALSVDCSSDDEEDKMEKMTATEKLVASIDKMQKDDSTSSSGGSND